MTIDCAKQPVDLGLPKVYPSVNSLDPLILDSRPGLSVLENVTKSIAERATLPLCLSPSRTGSSAACVASTTSGCALGGDQLRMSVLIIMSGGVNGNCQNFEFPALPVLLYVCLASLFYKEPVGPNQIRLPPTDVRAKHQVRTFSGARNSLCLHIGQRHLHTAVTIYAGVTITPS
jgi:hypothetical protein